MASNQYMTLRDVTSLDALNDPGTVGLVDQIVNVAPELDRIPGRIIPGTSYEATVITAYGNNAAFRGNNSGVPFSAPSLDEKRFNTFFFDCQFSIDEMTMIKRRTEGDTNAQVFNVIASAGVRQKALKLGKQFYYGSLNDPKGPPGLQDLLFTQRTQVDSRTGQKIDQVVNANGVTAGSLNVMWFLKTGPQGVHWLFGNGSGIIMRPWMLLPGQSAPDDTAANPSKQTAWKSNLSGWIGTSMAQVHAIGAIVNIDTTIAGNAATTAGVVNDLNIANLWAKFPIDLKPDLAITTQLVAYQLQAGRTVTNFVDGAGREWTEGAAPIANFATRLPTAGNIPLIVSDSLTPGGLYTLN